MIGVVNVIFFGSHLKPAHLIRKHRDRRCDGTRCQIGERERQNQGDEVCRNKTHQQRLHFGIAGLLAQKIRHGYITDGHKSTVMERQIRNEVRLILDLLVTQCNMVIAEERLVDTHAARENTAVEELRRRGR